MTVIIYCIIILSVCSLLDCISDEKIREQARNLKSIRIEKYENRKRTSRVSNDLTDFDSSQIMMVKNFNKRRNSRLKTVVRKLKLDTVIPPNFNRDSWSTPHNPDAKFVIFSSAFFRNLTRHEVIIFCGSARKVGFDGDIVVAVQDISPVVQREFQSLNVTVYSTTPDCVGGNTSSKSFNGALCSLYGLKNYHSLNIMRFHLYKWWTSIYSFSTLIMLADFRDVFFQSNPFTYKTFEWAPPAADLVVFQEAHPNSVINRCMWNSDWIKYCYGEEALKRIGHNTVICAGVTLGTRNAILVYVRKSLSIVYYLSVSFRYIHCFLFMSCDGWIYASYCVWIDAPHASSTELRYQRQRHVSTLSKQM